jgi:hypothetical protein
MAKRPAKRIQSKAPTKEFASPTQSNPGGGRFLIAGIVLALAAVPLWMPVAGFVASLRSGLNHGSIENSPTPNDLLSRTDGQRILDLAGGVISLGPRLPGSSAHEQARLLITGELEKAGLQIQKQTFQDLSGEKVGTFTNVIARIKAPPPSFGRIFIVARYDSPSHPDVDLPSAQGAAAGPAVLCEVARIIVHHPRLARRVDFVLLDGSSPHHQFGANDGLRGSRTHSASLGKGSSAGSDAVFVLHAVGGRDGVLTMPARVSRSLLTASKNIAADHDLPLVIRHLDRPVWDDDLPYLAMGRKVLLLSNADAPELGTADDTVITLSPEHLAATAQLLILLLTEMQ